MTTFGISRSLNEDDIIEWSMRRMCAQVDHVIIGDNSTDDTRAILASLIDDGYTITVLDDDEPNWRQRETMTALAHRAGSLGADWVVPFDIDEVWYAPGWTKIGDALADLPDETLIVEARNFTHCATAKDDPAEIDPFARMVWKNVKPLDLRKVACRVRPDLRLEHGQHSAHYDTPAPTVTDLIEIRHFPYRTPEQFIKRVEGAWPMLRDADMPEHYAAHLRAYGQALDDGGPEALRSWFYDGLFCEHPSENPELMFDPAPPCPSR